MIREFTVKSRHEFFAGYRKSGGGACRHPDEAGWLYPLAGPAEMLGLPRPHPKPGRRLPAKTKKPPTGHRRGLRRS